MGLIAYIHPIKKISLRSPGSKLSQDSGHLPAVIGLVIHHVPKRLPQGVGQSLACQVGIGQRQQELWLLQLGKKVANLSFDKIPTLHNSRQRRELLGTPIALVFLPAHRATPPALLPTPFDTDKVRQRIAL